MAPQTAQRARTVRPVRPPPTPNTASAAFKPAKKPVWGSRRSVMLIMLGMPLFLVSSLALYHRVIEGQEKKVQLGEYTPDGGLRMYTPEEKEKQDEKRLLTKIFGKDR